MWDFLGELFVQLVGELVPRRAATVLVALVLLVCGLAFVALAGYCSFELAAHRAEPSIAIVIVISLGLAGVCFGLLWSGVRPGSCS